MNRVNGGSAYVCSDSDFTMMLAYLSDLSAKLYTLNPLLKGRGNKVLQLNDKLKSFN